MEKLKLLSLFSGIGAFEKAFKNCNIPFKTVNWCEFDSHACKSYCAIHNETENNNLGDVTEIDETKLLDFDVMTYGFPCQSFSNAGLRLGFEDLDKGDLFFHSMRIAKYKQPKYLIAENVKGLVNHDKGNTLKTILNTLDYIGYNNYYQILNAKDYGVPQKRQRVFIVSIRKDIDKGNFQFPTPFDNGLRLMHYLEQNADDKYYLHKTKDYFIKHSFEMESKGNGFRFKPHVLNKAEYAFTITTRAGGRMDDNFVIDNIRSDNPIFEFSMKNPEFAHLELLDTIDINKYHIRRLTPLECFRLMGFANDDFQAAQSVVTQTQLYKQAGNSICVPVLEAIYKNLFQDYLQGVK